MKSYAAAATCILTLLVILAGCSLQRAGEQTSNVLAGVSQQAGLVGYGAATKGGTGGTVITLATTDAAAFKAAITKSGARIVRLTGSGIIDLTDSIDINTPFLTLDGSAAPNLQIRGGTLRVRTHDVIIRHLRIRPGDGTGNAPPTNSDPNETDAICLCGRGGADVYNIYLEQNSLMWGPDMGAVSMLDRVHDITLIGNILGPGVYLSRNLEAVEGEGHSMSTSAFRLIAGGHLPQRITFTGNLFNSADRRNPVVYGINMEIVSNVIYNWKRRSSGGNPSQANFINNYVKKGPMSTRLYAWSPQLHSQSTAWFPESIYEAGTVVDGSGMKVREPAAPIQGQAPVNVYRTTPWPMTIAAPLTAAAAYSSVLEQAGAMPRDSIDAKVIQDVRDGTGTFPNASDLSWTTQAGPTPTIPAPTATPVPPTAIPWIPLVCAIGTIEIEVVNVTTGRWRCQ